MKPELAHLLLLSCACLLGLIASGVLLYRDQRRSRQWAARIKDVASAHGASRSDLALGSRVFSLSRQTADQVGLVARLLRYDPLHRDIYPARPLVVLTLALVPAVVFAHVVAGFVGLAGWITMPGMCVLVCRSFFGWFDNRLSGTLYRQFPDALAMIVRAVRVGLPMVEAIRVVANESSQPTAREFAALVAQTTIGVPLEDALREMAERNRLPEYRFFATALSLQSQTGGGLTETLENLADTVRKRVAAKMRGHAIAAEARMSSYILGALPLVTGALLSLLNPDYMGVMFTDPSGRNLLLLAVVLLGIGAFSMRTLIRKSLS
ncbi:type II secretion system F family protein [Rhodopila sp.]|uniref:type II secretion system F family protein n=1 Tax=Rhodopila sp. TaxID=2480087 RepID=UPI003D0E4277